MSPYDTLKRISSSFAAPSRSELKRFRSHNDPLSKLSALKEEIQAVDDTFIAPLPFSASPKTLSNGPRWYLLADVLALTVGFVLAWCVAGLSLFFFHGASLSLQLLDHNQTAFVPYFVTSIGLLFWFALKGHYRLRQPFWTEIQQIVKAFGFSLLLNGFIQFAAKNAFSRLGLTLGWIGAGVCLLFFRAGVRAFLKHTGGWKLRTLLVGGGAVAEEARAALNSEPALGYEIVTQIENIDALLSQMNYSWRALCERFKADFVVVAMDSAELAETEDALTRLASEEIPFALAPAFKTLPVFGVSRHYFFSRNVTLLVPNNNLQQPLAQAFKRFLDLCGAGLGLCALAPLFVIIALIVKMDGGPAFFGDLRVGRDGKIFRCLKFRTMVVNADALLWRYLETHPEKRAEWTTYRKLRDGDPRVTKIGSLLRKWSLDELPQLLNVFWGDMSLVGPRPIMIRERTLYRKDLHQYCRVRPGLTGLWQVSGRSCLTFADRIQLDMWYVRNWSLWHDVAILCKTLPAILKKTGAC